MPYKLNRPAADFDSGTGLFHLEHFQMAYVTNDMERARALFRDRLGIREFRTLEGGMPGGGHIQADFAWVGTLMYELIHATGPGAEIFAGRLPETDRFAIRHHHLGYLVQDQAQWDAVLANAARQHFPVPHQSDNPLVKFCFVEVPELGHYLEYLFATPAGIEFFEGVPRN